MLFQIIVLLRLYVAIQMDSCYNWWNYEGYVIVNLREIDIESNNLQLFRICYFVY